MNATAFRVLRFVTWTFLLSVFAGLPFMAFAQTATLEDGSTNKTRPFTVHAIGRVENTEGRAAIVLEKKFQPGLLGLDGFSHVWVFWWFDRSDTPQQRSILQVHPRGNRDNPLTGVFATRAPVRPNLIAMSLCKIKSVKENVVEVDAIDAFAGTPVLDLKPYAPGIDSATATGPGWARGGPPNSSGAAGSKR